MVIVCSFYTFEDLYNFWQACTCHCGSCREKRVARSVFLPASLAPCPAGGGDNQDCCVFSSGERVGCLVSYRWVYIHFAACVFCCILCVRYLFVCTECIKPLKLLFTHLYGLSFGKQIFWWMCTLLMCTLCVVFTQYTFLLLFRRATGRSTSPTRFVSPSPRRLTKESAASLVCRRCLGVGIEPQEEDRQVCDRF